MIGELEKRELIEVKKSVQKEFLNNLIVRLTKDSNTSIYINFVTEVERLGKELIKNV